MKINYVKLNNIRSYDDTKVEFDDGLSLIQGSNGSGKSSLLTGIFGGLYFSKILRYMNGDLTLDSLVRREQDEGEIELQFELDKSSYTINWVIKVTEKDGEREAGSKSCILTSPELNESIEGVKNVRNKVIELTGFSTESFVNSVYVQQGDISRILEADLDKRKEIIDGLLGLSKIDTYIERMNLVRRELGAQKRRINDLIEEKENQLSEYRSFSELNTKLEEKNKSKENAQDVLEKIESKIDTKKEKKTNLEQQLETITEKEQQLETLKEKYEKSKQTFEERKQKQQALEQQKEAISFELQTVIELVEEDLEELGFTIDDVKEFNQKYEEIENKKIDLEAELQQLNTLKQNVVTEKQRLTNDIEELNNKIDSDIEAKEDLITEIEELLNKCKKEREQILDKKQRKEQLEKDLNKTVEILNIEKEDSTTEFNISQLIDIQNKIVSEIQEIFEEKGRKSIQKEQYESLQDGDNCPVCNTQHEYTDEIEEEHQQIIDIYNGIESEITDVKEKQTLLNELNNKIQKLQTIKTDIEKLEQQKDNTQEKIGEKNRQKRHFESKIQEKQDEIEKLENEIKKSKEMKEEYEQKINSITNELSSLTENIEKYDSIKEQLESKEQLEQEVSELEKDIEHISELKKEARKQYIEYDAERDTQKELLDEIEDKNNLNNEISETEDDINQLEEKKQKMSSVLEEVINDIAELTQEKNHVENVTERISELEDEKINVSKEETEAEESIEEYNDLKKKLRTQNMGYLNKYANEIFKSVYNSTVYQQLHITEDYEVSLLTSDGSELKPAELSGGEETIVSLAIRASIYRLLVERKQNTDTLPPFILDEPTTYLDDKHVQNMQKVIETITSWNVKQVFIVSHNENMIQNADVKYTVSKDPITEVSTVEKES